ncbi:MAG TPA: hypothetical protein P5089_02840 [Candidatus Portnoybacteria bacterium]|nr:hypothetical protein [Candidatus Portnoybacteria bacterium]
MKIIFAVAIVVLAVFILYRFFILPRKIDKAIKGLYRHPGEENWQKNHKVAYNNTPESQGEQKIKNLFFGKKVGVSAGG